MVFENFELVHDPLAVEVNIEDVGEFFHENFCHLYGPHYHAVVLSLQHSGQVTVKERGYPCNLRNHRLYSLIPGYADFFQDFRENLALQKTHCNTDNKSCSTTT